MGLAHNLFTGVQDWKQIAPAPPMWPEGNGMEDSAETRCELESSERTKRARPNTSPQELLLSGFGGQELPYYGLEEPPYMI